MTVTLQEFIEEALTTAWDGLHRATEDLTLEQLRLRPSAGVNSIGFLLWHVSRVEDNFVQRFILRGDEVWSAGGWQEKFGYETRGIGTGFTEEDTEKVVIPAAAVMLGYLDEVNQRTRDYLKGLDWSTLPEKPRGDRFPEWSIQTILRQLIAHSNQHLGEINYVRGLQGIGGVLG